MPRGAVPGIAAKPEFGGFGKALPAFGWKHRFGLMMVVGRPEPGVNAGFGMKTGVIHACWVCGAFAFGLQMTSGLAPATSAGISPMPDGS
jgi:hypothetical protein